MIRQREMRFCVLRTERTEFEPLNPASFVMRINCADDGLLPKAYSVSASIFPFAHIFAAAGLLTLIKVNAASLILYLAGSRMQMKRWT